MNEEDVKAAAVQAVADAYGIAKSAAIMPALRRAAGAIAGPHAGHFARNAIVGGGGVAGAALGAAGGAMAAGEGNRMKGALGGGLAGGAMGAGGAAAGMKYAPKAMFNGYSKLNMATGGAMTKGLVRARNALTGFANGG